MDAQSPAVEPSEGAGTTNPIGALLLDEADRLAVLESHGPDTLLDDPELKAAVDFAGALCEAPIALVSLVEADMSVTQQLRGTIDRQWGDGLTVVIRLPGDALA